ncbi:hypothetical protein PFISCL1PPCAC_1121 [Pristionchus fissidentatus]|uniref:Uncharacterized protein n=1 Tax=Pristionchus fissidentatus TaxID=1538716 RepID=A0AAV5UUG1_9BILA|nr:hypothetical protein PFISCL1PPCAC_1121 [Pristionchus fissidentatus]
MRRRRQRKDSRRSPAEFTVLESMSFTGLSSRHSSLQEKQDRVKAENGMVVSRGGDNAVILGKRRLDTFSGAFLNRSTFPSTIEGKWGEGGLNREAARDASVPSTHGVSPPSSRLSIEDDSKRRSNECRSADKRWRCYYHDDRREVDTRSGTCECDGGWEVERMERRRFTPVSPNDVMEIGQSRLTPHTHPNTKRYHPYVRSPTHREPKARRSLVLASLIADSLDAIYGS